MEVGLEPWGMVRGEPAADTTLGRSQTGMDKDKRCGRTTMGQKAGASCMMRLRWENLGKEELQYVSVSMWRVNPPQRSCPVWTGPKYLPGPGVLSWMLVAVEPLPLLWQSSGHFPCTEIACK